MRLRQIEIFGFKSFADRTVVNLDEGITGVVGPNGSGKSNIGDAVRWVLGEQSARQLRGGKMEDVIFSGTQKRKPLAYAEVTLLFDNSDHALPIDFSEVSVTRRMYRSGESDYAINKSPCRLREIVELFRDSGIGREGYSLVGQGRVDEILANRPEDRRNVFHEAAGVMKYRVRLEETRKHLEGAQANLDRLQDKMEVLGAQLEPLRQQSEDARLYQNLSAELRETELGLFVHQYEQLNAKAAAARETLARLEAVLDQQQQDENANNEALAKLQTRIDEVEEASAQAYRRAADLENEAAQHENALLLMENDRRHADEQREQLESEARREIAQAESFRREAQGLEDRLADPESSDASWKDAVDAIEKEIASLDEELKLREEELSGLRSRAMESLENLSGISGDLSRNAQQQKNVQERLEQLDFLLARSKDTLQALDESLKDSGEEADKNGRALAAAQEKAENNRKDREALQSRAERMQEAMARGRERIQQGKTRLQMLEAMQRDYTGYQESVRRLLKDAQKAPELAGTIEHVVAEVMQVPKNYRVAIETVLGSALQQIITPDEEAAKKAIAYLRSHQYGRATFLPVNVIRGRTLNAQERRYADMAGCCGVAAELVETEERYRAIVDSLLGRTLVAEDMDSAVSIARACGHNLRIVTLQGDLIQTGGAMSGGSLRSHNTSLLGRDQEVRQTREMLETWQNQFAELAHDLETLRGEIREAEEQGDAYALTLRKAELAVAQTEMEIRRLEESRAREEENLTQWQDESERLNDQLKDLVKRGEQMTSSREDLSASGEDARRLAAEMQEKINLLREDRDEAMERLSDARSRWAEYLKDRESAQRQIERLIADAERLERSAAQRRSNGEAILARRAEEDVRAEEIRAGVEKARQDRKASLELHERLENEKNTLREEYARREAQNARQRTDLRALFEERQNAENDRIRAEGDLEHIQSRIWDLYEVTYAAAKEACPADFAIHGAQTRADGLRRKIRALGAVNIHAIEEYAESNEQYRIYVSQREDLIRSRDGLLELADELSSTMQERFLANFTVLNRHFGEIFARLFGGGQAKLSLTDPDDPLNSGIEIEVEPPGKRLQRLSLLSGGEKAFTAIALLFSMLRLKPTPFCILDEIDAALDDANLVRYARFLKEVYAQNTQFVVVTHRKPSMEICDRLYGVTMEEKGVSKMISMQLSDVKEQE